MGTRYCDLPREEIIRVMDFFLHKQCDLGRMKNTPYDNPELIWEVVHKVFEEWKQFTDIDSVNRGWNYCWYDIVKNIPGLDIEDIVDKVEMRPATKEEMESVNEYIHSISKKTRVNILDI